MSRIKHLIDTKEETTLFCYGGNSLLRGTIESIEEHGRMIRFHPTGAIADFYLNTSEIIHVSTALVEPDETRMDRIRHLIETGEETTVACYRGNSMLRGKILSFEDHEEQVCFHPTGSRFVMFLYVADIVAFS